MPVTLTGTLPPIRLKGSKAPPPDDRRFATASRSIVACPASRPSPTMVIWGWETPAGSTGCARYMNQEFSSSSVSRVRRAPTLCEVVASP